MFLVFAKYVISSLPFTGPAQRTGDSCVLREVLHSNLGDAAHPTESQDSCAGTDNESVTACSVTSRQESMISPEPTLDKRLCLRSSSTWTPHTQDASTATVFPKKRIRHDEIPEEEEAPDAAGFQSPPPSSEPRSTQSLEFALQQAAASLEEQVVRESRERRLADAQRNLSEKQYIDEEEIEILDEVDPNESGDAPKDRIKRRRRNGTKFTPPPKNRKSKKENPALVGKSAKKHVTEESPKNSKVKGPLKVQFCGKLLNKRKKESNGSEAAALLDGETESRIGAEPQTPTALSPQTRRTTRQEPNRLHVAATPGVYALKKRGEWFLCGICKFKSKQVTDIARHLKNYDYYTAHCPSCKHVVTKTHRGPDNKILSCLHCDYRNGDHIESNTPKEDIVAIAAKTIYDDDDEPQIVSEITDECGNPVKVLSTERDLEELRKMGAVTLNSEVSAGSLAHLSITADDSDVIRIDVAAPSSSKGTPTKAKRIPAILQRRRKR